MSGGGVAEAGEEGLFDGRVQKGGHAEGGKWRGEEEGKGEEEGDEFLNSNTETDVLDLFYWDVAEGWEGGRELGRD